MDFLQVLLPIFGIFALGFIGQKTIGFDTKTISKMSLYLMSPILTFQTFYTNSLSMTYVYLGIFLLILCFTIIGIVYLIGFIKQYPTNELCGMILASAFMNNGNYGTPVVLLVFGAIGLDIAIVLMVLQQLIMCTVGVYYAAKGSPEANGFRSALRAVQRMPIMYGAALGIIFQYMNIPLSNPIQEAVSLVASATIPTIMIVLGMQLANIKIKNLAINKLSFSLSLKLFLSPVIAFIITLFLPVDEMTKQIMIIIAAMPSAANTTMYALQFDTDTDFVSSSTLISTCLSLLTLPIVLSIVL
ncbi:AEC family transporter [Metabacillus iocasae]|uniref:Permease n=1 Tax=Priestia iocasae TaxID=2291674 RepID=A0ABS2QV27_9BACI|nr:AEC family transporter [Metabacillus iocasae]MBM7703292.1 putative permease [Metabacillus iocasae]